MSDQITTRHTNRMERRKKHTWIWHLFHPQRSNKHRPKVLHPDWLAVLTLGIGLIGVGSQLLPRHYFDQVLGFDSSITVEEVVSLTNQERVQLDLEPLVLNPVLSQAALAKAQDMMTDQYWSHTAPDGTEPWHFFQVAGYDYNVAGENLARDFSNSQAMTRAWMNSPTHRDNIINNRYQEIGVAVIDGNLMGTETTLVVQLFGRPKNGVVGAVPTTSSNAITNQLTQTADQVADQPTPAAPEIEQTILTQDTQPINPEVLAGWDEPLSYVRDHPLLSPLAVTKAGVLALAWGLILVLVYDLVVIGHRRSVRLVGDNLGHILFLSTISFLIIFFQSGLIK